MRRVTLVIALACAAIAAVAAHAASQSPLLLAVERAETHFQLPANTWRDQSLVYLQRDRGVEEAVVQPAAEDQPPGGFVLRGIAARAPFATVQRAVTAVARGGHDQSCQAPAGTLADVSDFVWRITIPHQGQAAHAPTVLVRSGDAGLPACSAAVVDLMRALDRLLFTVAHQRGTTILASST